MNFVVGSILGFSLLMLAGRDAYKTFGDAYFYFVGASTLWAYKKIATK